jgi:hypothetical protein
LIFAITLSGSAGFSQETLKAEKKDPKDDPIYKLERDLMDRTVVNVLPKNEKPYEAKRLEHAVFRFGDETNKVENATVWVWQDKGRPVAIQKIEVNKFNAANPGWTYCFSCLSESLVQVQWPNRRQPYASRSPVEFQEIPDAPKPGPESVWKQQARSLSRQFSVSTGGKSNKVQLRLLPKPIHVYRSEELGIIDGSIFSFATGTNPCLYLIIEVRDAPAGPQWVYGSSRATSHAIQLRHNDVEVRAEGGAYRPGHFPTWTYDWLPRERNTN